MRQPPVYVLNHSQHNFRQRTTQRDLYEIEDWTDRAARRMYESAGLGPLFLLFYLVEIRHRHFHSDFRAGSEALDAISL